METIDDTICDIVKKILYINKTNTLYRDLQVFVDIAIHLERFQFFFDISQIKMSRVHIKVWNRNKTRVHHDDGIKEVPEELLASYISQSKIVDENSNRDLFWVI